MDIGTKTKLIAKPFMKPDAITIAVSDCSDNVLSASEDSPQPNSPKNSR